MPLGVLTMTEFIVTCIGRDGPAGTHTGISHLGGPHGTWTRREVVRAIEAGEHTFAVLVGGRPVQVAVVSGAIDRYLRGRVGGFWTDDLLTLPQCPES
jgi:hypothetical protein